MKGKFTAVLFVLIFILIAGLVFIVLSSLDRIRAAEPSPTPAAYTAGDTVNTVPAATSTPYLLPSPTPTLAPAAVTVATPAPTPVPTPVPVQTPLPTTAPTTVPVQTTLTSGSFSSQTGTWLNITADWSVTSLDQSRAQVTVSVSAVSYALHYSGFPRSLNISLDGQYVSLDPPSIVYDGGEQAIHSLGTTNFTIDLPANSSKTLALQVEWQFNGEMGGPNGRMLLDSIECGGTINVAR